MCLCEQLQCQAQNPPKCVYVCACVCGGAGDVGTCGNRKWKFSVRVLRVGVLLTARESCEAASMYVYVLGDPSWRPHPRAI